jgi:hypothetical protein
MTPIDIDLRQDELKLMIKSLKRYQLEELTLYFAFAYDIKNDSAGKIRVHDETVHRRPIYK